MKRLTRPAIEVDETVTKYLGKEIRLESINDRLLELILNGPTLMAVKKDVLRQVIRQLYGALKAYEDIEMEPQAIEQTLMNFSSFLMEMTGGRMSKTNYTVQAMVSEANDHFERVCDECRERAADVVEVVRCRCCKYRDPENWHCDHPMGTIVSVPRKPDDFCSYGERKESVLTIPVNDLYDEDGGEVMTDDR